MKSKTKFSKFILLSLLLFLFSCERYLTIDPPISEITTENIYSNDELATSAIRGLYSKIMEGGFGSGGEYSITFLCARSADEFINYSSNDFKHRVSGNNLLPSDTELKSYLWAIPYQIIYGANSAIENLMKSPKVSASVKKQLIAEAKFLRAFCFFYLTNLFGEVPLILTSDYRDNATAKASAQMDIYGRIASDLLEVKDELSEIYPTADRIRANKWAASGLLSRIYLYKSDWQNAEKEATEVIEQSHLYKLENDLNNVFLKTSREAILQFDVQFSNGEYTREGERFILTSAPGVSTEVVLDERFLSKFEKGDMRLSKWVGAYHSGAGLTWHYPFKYKSCAATPLGNEYSMVLRLAEQYLIRAEARIHQNKVSLGIDDLNFIRDRSRATPTAEIPDPLPAYANNLGIPEALLAIEQERKIELFSEWGHRWLDLKRTSRANAILSPIKALDWQNTDVLYPIPVSEILNNSNLIQNKGYN